MTASRALFPGAMGPEGFVSCFDQLLPERELRRMLVLKGGPGVGKSTFMRRLHAALTAGGEASTLCFCSGDPDSLDAVVVPGRGVLILDGTAPHTIDPRIPGARDSIINLGACLNEEAMRPRLAHIRACMEDHAACMQRAQAHMRAAWALQRECAASAAACTDETRMARLTDALVAAALSIPGARADAPHTRRIITDAITPKGEMSLLAAGDDLRVIRLARHFSMDLTSVLRTLSRAALRAGYDVEEHLAPMYPGSLLHVSIPALHTLITTSETLPAEQTFDFTPPSACLLRRECALEQSHAAMARSTQLAVSALAQAKQLHDELETFYVPSMDFSRWQTMLDETLASLGA